MSALGALTLRRPERRSDEQLVAGHRAGEPDAFPAICDRYERRLVRFAAGVLGARRQMAEDVVQEALFRAHRTLLRDDAPIHLSGWLHRLVRNCCLDELGRTRREHVPLHELTSDAAAPRDDPAAVSHRREQARETLADLAALPDAQRHALVRRELDGMPHEEIARELGLTVPATRSLCFRARENLLKARDARDAPCADVRADLLRAHDDRRRAATRTYRHLAGCSACRDFRTELGRLRGTLRLLSPLPAIALAVTALKGAAAPGWAVKAAAGTAAAVTLAGGVHVLGAGDPAPVRLVSPALPGGELRAGSPIPPRTALVTKTVTVVSGAAPEVALPCPPGMRVAGLAPVDAARPHGYTSATLVGASRVARIAFARGAAAATVTVGTLCRTPSAAGSVLAADATARAASGSVPVCSARAALYATPRGAVRGTVVRRQPVAVRALRPGWIAVTTDAGERGWLRRGALC